MAPRICFMPLLLLFTLTLLQTIHSEKVNSRAAYYTTSDGLGTSSGACGYDEFGRDLNGGNVAAVSQSLYRNGAGCGACYHVRCTNEHLCSDSGVTVVATDHGEGDRTDFIMSSHAFTKMAQQGKDKQLSALGVVDIQYQRVACQYPGHNILVKIKESSNCPYYLSLIFWYQGGERDIVAVEISQEKSSGWKAMRRSHGAVWDIASPPRGDLALRLQLPSGEWIYAANHIPANWQAGAVYDSGVQLEY